MKTKVKKSVQERLREIENSKNLKQRVMLRAWLLKNSGVTRYMEYTTGWGGKGMTSYRVYDFSSCLKEAWKIEKENDRIEKLRETMPVSSAPIISQEAYDSFYRGCSYYGD